MATAQRATSKLVASIDAALAAGTTLQEAEKERESARRLAAEAALKVGFADVVEAQAAVRDEAQVAVLQSTARSAREQAAAVAELLADPDLEVAATPPAPVQDATARSRAAQAAGAGRAAAGHSHPARRAAHRAGGRARRRLRELAPVAEAAQRAKEMADLAAGIGPNRLNMPLSAYVLAARLEEVAEVASGRLRAMTQGRYTLVHSDARTGNARSGLRLLVSDAWTGQDRDTATLSGGETFMASLALAAAWPRW